METVTVNEAKKRFSELVARAANGERFLIQRTERPAVMLSSAAEFEAQTVVMASLTQQALQLGQDPNLLKRITTGEVHPIMAAFGLWRDERELDDLTDEIYANRLRQPTRAEVSL
jgi:prevent-host-death family protein